MVYDYYDYRVYGYLNEHIWMNNCEECYDCDAPSFFDMCSCRAHQPNAGDPLHE